MEYGLLDLVLSIGELNGDYDEYSEDAEFHRNMALLSLITGGLALSFSCLGIILMDGTLGKYGPYKKGKMVPKPITGDQKAMFAFIFCGLSFAFGLTFMVLGIYKLLNTED